MAPKPKNVPSRLGPPPQLARITLVQQQEKFQPKMREILAKNAKMLAKWAHEKMTWKKLLMSWMVILVASKMVLLMLTYKFFTLTSLISLQVSHRFFQNIFFKNFQRKYLQKKAFQKRIIGNRNFLCFHKLNFYGVSPRQGACYAIKKSAYTL